MGYLRRESAMQEPTDFLLLDMDSGNAVATYHSQPEAERALRRVVEGRPREEIEDLVLVAYDKLGNAVSRTLAVDLLEGPLASR
jgi:hypothetical protein